MTPPRSRARRALHGVAAASFATFVALASHVLAGGESPTWIGVLAPWTLSVAASTLIAGRTLSLPRLSAAVVASQGLFHALFSLGAAPAATATGAAAAGSHAGHGAPVAFDATAIAASADAAMWGWHAVAAVVTIAALYHGERVLTLLATLTSRFARWVAAILPAPAPIAGPRLPGRAPVLRMALPAGVHPVTRPLRGPPLLGSL